MGFRDVIRGGMPPDFPWCVITRHSTSTYIGMGYIDISFIAHVECQVACIEESGLEEGLHSAACVLTCGDLS